MVSRSAYYKVPTAGEYTHNNNVPSTLSSTTQRHMAVAQPIHIRKKAHTQTIMYPRQADSVTGYTRGS